MWGLIAFPPLPSLGVPSVQTSTARELFQKIPMVHRRSYHWAGRDLSSAQIARQRKDWRYVSADTHVHAKGVSSNDVKENVQPDVLPCTNVGRQASRVWADLEDLEYDPFAWQHVSKCKVFDLHGPRNALNENVPSCKIGVQEMPEERVQYLTKVTGLRPYCRPAALARRMICLTAMLAKWMIYSSS